MEVYMITSDDVKRVLAHIDEDCCDAHIDVDTCTVIAAYLDTEEYDVDDLKEHTNITLVRELYRFKRFLSPLED